MEERREGQARLVRQRSGPGLFGLLIVIVVVGPTLLLYWNVRKEPPVQAEERIEEPVDPFAGLPPETPPEKQAQTRGEAAREGGK